MIAPLSLFLIVLPPALAAWRGLRVVWVMVAGVAGLALFGLMLWMTLAGVWPFGRQDGAQDTYYVVAHWHYVITLALLVAAIAVAQAVKSRRGDEARQVTLTLFALLIGGMALMLAPLTFARATGMGTGPALAWVGEIGGQLGDLDRDGLGGAEVAEAASKVGAIPEVRAALLAFQRRFARLDNADRDAVARAMQQVGIEALAQRPATVLSGGELARTLLARALAVGAPLLLADEPVAALDPFHQLQVMEILRARADGGDGILAVLHDLGLAARFMDRIVVMHRGEVVADGLPGEVLSDGLLAEVFRVAARPAGEGGVVPVPWRALP